MALADTFITFSSLASDIAMEFAAMAETPAERKSIHC
jgi:hypothetical protein